MNLKLIKNIQLPQTNNYYELDSADGYAYLGYALKKIGENYNDCLSHVHNKKYRLNANKKVPTNKNVFEETNYTYTISVCMDFMNEINEKTTLKKLFEIIKNIGFYTNCDMFRYCDTEIEYGVPNVTSGAAYIFAMMGDVENCMKCINYLRKNQQNGNWFYYLINDKVTKLKIKEDSFHLSMMVFHLRMVEKLLKIKTDDIYLSSLEELKIINKNVLSSGTIGWGIPMLYLATKGIEDNLNKRSYNEIIKNSINHKNFRVRGLSAFCLTKEI